MIIAITGATGFIGKYLIKKHIDLNDDVRILSRTKGKYSDFEGQVQIYIGDLADVDSLIDFTNGADVLYHCAAEIREESKMYAINVEGTKNLIKAASGKIKHWVQLSSTGVYGPIYNGIVNESQPYNPINEYEKTKLKSDFLVLEAAKEVGFTSTLVRPSNVFGFEMKNKSLFQLVKTIDKGLYFFVGLKGASANYVPVENVIEALYLAATKQNAKNQIYIVSSFCTIEEFVELIVKYLKKPMPRLRIPIGLIKSIARLTSFIPKNPLTVSRVNALRNRSIYETKKIENELGYKPVVTTEETIMKLVQFYKNKK
jgi:nucleoside-diphosphate-sugar epimerase